MNFNFISGFNNHSVGGEILPESNGKGHVSHTVLKYTCRLRLLISPKSMYLYCCFRQCRLASSGHGIRLLNLISYVCEHIAGGRMKEDPLCCGRGWSGRISLFRGVGSFFCACITPTSFQGLLRIPVLFLIYFILRILFLFFKSLQIKPYQMLTIRVRVDLEVMKIKGCGGIVIPEVLRKVKLRMLVPP